MVDGLHAGHEGIVLSMPAHPCSPAGASPAPLGNEWPPASLGELAAFLRPSSTEAVCLV